MRSWLVVALSAFLLAVTASEVSAQTRIRVTRGQATIWRAGFSIVAAVVPTGTELEAVARRGAWYEVVLPSTVGPMETTGFIARTQVEIISGPEPPERPLGSATPSGPSDATTLSRPPSPPTATSGAEPAFGVRGFGAFGYQWYNARDSFDAIFGQPGGFQFGGGAEVRFSNAFVQASVERFHRTGQRAFASEGDVFGLGISDEVTIVPIAFTAGYRFHRRSMNPYVGGGVGRIHIKESSAFSDAQEGFGDTFTSYHVVAGLQWRVGNPWWGTAFEVQYTHAPNALKGGLADALGEHNLGGVEARVKLEIGK